MIDFFITIFGRFKEYMRAKKVREDVVEKKRGMCINIIDPKLLVFETIY